jgi:hypothetical protein
MAYEDWTIKFWQWLISIPRKRNPALDRIGVNAAVAQFGQPVFNLVFSDGTLKYPRQCTLRAWQHILVPLNVCVATLAEYPNAKDEKDLKIFAEWEFKEDCDPRNTLIIDEKPQGKNKLAGFRVTSRSFDVNFPNDPIFGIPGKSTAVSDGYWIILDPLPAGYHTIEFGATLNNPLTGKLFYKDHVRYDINVLG